MHHLTAPIGNRDAPRERASCHQHRLVHLLLVITRLPRYHPERSPYDVLFITTLTTGRTSPTTPPHRSILRLPARDQPPRLEVPRCY